MLTQEDVVEIHALKRRGWSNAAIARHTGRDRKTIRRHLRGWKPTRGTEPSVLEPYRPYLEARFADDPHVFATVLARELEGLGFRRSYPTLVRELRRLALRPACSCCRAGTQLTVAIAHEPGEELQLDWLELHETPWARKAYVLVGVLSHSGRIRGVFSEGMSFAHLAAALDQLLRRFGGTARCWRTDRMATFVHPGTGRLRAEAAELAKHYGVAVAICPPERPQRKGAVEKGIDYLTRSWWTSAPVATPAQAQADLDRWAVSSADRRRRGGESVGSLASAEPLLALPHSRRCSRSSARSTAPRWSPLKATATRPGPSWPASSSRSGLVSASLRSRSARQPERCSPAIAGRRRGPGRRSAPAPTPARSSARSWPSFRPPLRLAGARPTARRASGRWRRQGG